MTSILDPVADADGAPTYTQVLGTYALPIQGQPYTFVLSKVSIQMNATDGTLAHRVLKLSLGRGEEPNLTFKRYEWPCVMIEYTHAYDPVSSVKIDFIGNFGGPESCVLSPSPLTSPPPIGTLNLYVSIALSIIDTFFPGANVYLQDAATADVVDRTDAGQFDTYDTFPLALSALKLFAGRPTTAYGGFGFFSADRPEGRLAVLSRVYKTRTVAQAVNDYLKDNKVKNFFHFYDHGIDLNPAPPKDAPKTPMGPVVEVPARVQALSALLGTPFSLDRTFAEVSGALSALVASSVPKDTRVAARQLFNYLQEMFIGNFVIRLQKRVPGAWEAFRVRESIGSLLRLPPPPEARVEYPSFAETEGRAAEPYEYTFFDQPAIQSLATEKRALARRMPAYAEGPTAISSWLSVAARAPRPAPAPRPTPGPAPPMPRMLRSRTPYSRPTGAP